MSTPLVQPEKQQNKQERPESLRLTLQMWAGALILQLIHVILSVIVMVVDPSGLEAAARQTAESQEMEEISESMIAGSVIASVVLMAVINLLILGLLTWALREIQERGKHAASMRRLWIVFAIYFGLQAATVFLLSPAGSDAPDVLFLLDGSVQILTGVIAVMGIAFASKEETLKWLEPEEHQAQK